MSTFFQFLLLTILLLPNIFGDLTTAQEKVNFPNGTTNYLIEKGQDKLLTSQSLYHTDESNKVTGSSIIDNTSDDASDVSMRKPDGVNKNRPDAILESNIIINAIDLLLNPVKMDEKEKITVTLTNSGSTSVSSREIKYYLSSDNIITSSDYYIGRDLVSLSGGEQGTENISFTPKEISGLTEGVYYVGIIIPDENEYWWRNGTLTISSAGLADLIIPYIELSANPVNMDESETITTTFKNQGTAEVSSREVEYYLSTDNVITTIDFYLGHDYVSLSSGEQGTESITFTPNEISNVVAGIYYVGIIIPEENEYWYRNGTLSINPSGIPNLVLYTMELSANPINISDSETITTTIKNEGTASVSGRQIQYYLSADNIITTTDFYIGDDNVSLSANEQGTETITFTPQSISGIKAGTYYVGVIIPDEYEYWCRNGTLIINSIGMPNIVITTIELSANPVNINDNETITTTLKNEGTATVSSREIQYYLSVDNIITTTDFYLGDDRVSLSSGEQGTESITITLKEIAGLGAGIYYVGVIIPDEYEYWVRNGTLTINDAGYPDIDIFPSSLTINQANGEARKNNKWIDYIKDNNTMNNEKPIKHTLGLIVPDSIKEYWETHSPKMNELTVALPLSIDWSSYDSPVKDQGSCGSCWAFAAIALVENIGNKTDLSEQEIVACVDGDCEGGWYEPALLYIKNNGVSPESCYPYNETNGNCSQKCADPSYREKITTVNGTLWGDLPNVNDIKAALQSGPIVVHLGIPSDLSFDNYYGGIYNYNGGNSMRGYHAVEVVGYNDEQQCFKAKNSWGKDWGENGYFRIAYDDVTDDIRFGGYAASASGAYSQDNNSNNFAISNIGKGSLTITGISSNKNWLSISGYPTTPFNISSNETQEVSITINWSLVSSTSDAGRITITSNDPDESSVQVQVTAIKSETNNPPTVKITSPVNNQSFSTANITVQGTADDESPGTVSKVEIKLNNGQWKSADGTKNWNSSVNLQPGNNDIYARSKDNTNQYSKEASVTVQYNEAEEVLLAIEGPSEVSNNQEFELGVKISEVTNLKVISFDFIFPTQYVDYTGYTLGTIIPSSQATVVPDEENGKISTSVFTLAGSGSGTGIIIKFKFKILNSPPRSSSFSFCYDNILANNESGNSIPIKTKCLEIPLIDGIAVWPGDANNDGVVNIIDINPIIINFNAKGPARNPNGIQWIGQTCEPWNPVNRTYSDCNGNGSIEITDINGVVVNFNKSHSLTSNLIVNAQEGINPTISAYFKPGAKAGEEFWVYVNIGSADLPVNAMNIISYELVYTGAEYIDYISYEPGSFLSGMTSYVIPDVNPGKISTSSFNLSQGYTGYGEAFKYKFRVADTVNSPHNILFYWGLVSANRVDGTIQPLDTLSFIDAIVPVELTSFSASLLKNEIILNWTTITEKNNYGFEVERHLNLNEWENIGFIPGHGNTTEICQYAFRDKVTESGTYSYRLKQIDYDGSSLYSQTILLDAAITPIAYSMSQNFPNPFNPSTIIKYDIPEDCHISLTIYNVLGDKVATLVNEQKAAGSYEVNFNASNFANGVYFYELRANNYRDVKKLILLK